MNTRKSILLGIAVAMTVLLVTIGVSYAYFTANLTGGEETTTITVTGGTMNITYNGGANISVTNIIPSDNPAATKTFTITGNNTTDINMMYQLNLKIESNSFSKEALKYKLISNNTNNNGQIVPSVNNLTNIGTGSKTIFLGAGNFDSPTSGNKVHTYNLEIYFPNTGTNQNIDQEKEMKAYIKIQDYDLSYIGYNESKGVNQPVLFTEMTPVIWDGNEFIETEENDPTWYDYDNKKWANARTKDGSYWVWIPRYAYKITSGYHTNNVGTIEVKFLKGTSNKSTDTTLIETTGYIAGTKDTSMHYFLHPAFQFNGEELGFWIAKYEPTAAEGTIYTKTCADEEISITKTVKIEPNKTSWRCNINSNMFEISKIMKNKTDVYGWLSTEVDTHLMKNTEWGAVSYLSKSKYGAHAEEVWNNAYNQYQTGCSGTSVNATDESICVTYETENGQKASTTHNITGVYDMSGGAWEHVSGNYNNLAGNSNFTDLEVEAIDSKYITRYKTLTNELLGGVGMNYDSSVYGDAIYETSNNAARYNGTAWIGDISGSWNKEDSYLPRTSVPWLYRGGHYNYGARSGLFIFHDTKGEVNLISTFRPVAFALK